MQKKVWLSGAMAALGAAMLLAAAFAGPASSKSNQPSASGQKKGGTMNVNASATDVDYIDPGLAYGTLSWQILDAVCVKLLYYPDKPDPAGSKLVPDGAVGFPAVSKDGKTYTFTIKSGIKSNTGETLTAANYAAAINRVTMFTFPVFRRTKIGPRPLSHRSAAWHTGGNACVARARITMWPRSP
jgi:ABC-type transport system substrate-binding protein